MFGKTTGGSFLQISEESDAGLSGLQKFQEKRMRSNIVKALQKTALHFNSPRLMLIATSARLDAFGAVKAEIDKMIAELKKQSADEVKERDWCIAELNANKLSLEAKYDEQTNLVAKEEDLTST